MAARADDEPFDPDAVLGRGLKIASDSIAEHECLAYVQNFALSVCVNVASGRFRKVLKLINDRLRHVSNGHMLSYTIKCRTLAQSPDGL